MFKLDITLCTNGKLEKDKAGIENHQQNARQIHLYSTIHTQRLKCFTKNKKKYLLCNSVICEYDYPSYPSNCFVKSVLKCSHNGLKKVLDLLKPAEILVEYQKCPFCLYS